MPFHPTANTSMCHLRTQNGTNLQENTFAYHWTGSPPSDSELTNLAIGVANTIGAALRAVTSNSWVFREVYCRNIDTEVANEATFVYPTGITGQRVGSQVAASEACGIVKRTGRTGHKMHGRNSISGFIENDVDGNSVSSGLMSLLAQLALQILLPQVTGRFQAAVAHIPRVPLVIGDSTPIVEAVVLDSNIDSQKTRLNSHGR